MSHLHELLAVESSLENQATKVRGELLATFDKKRHLFSEKRVVYTPNTEGGQAQVETQSDLQSTVVKELAWIQPFLSKSLDASYQVAEANTSARADVILEDETVLLTAVPATALLELEKRMGEIQALIVGIPTLDPALGFQPDGSREAGVYQARPVTKRRTKKDKRVIVLYPATPEHPAQTQLIDEDTVTGTIQEQEWSGLITPARKADLLARVEMVSRAVRRARSRANEQAVDTTKRIGSKILSHIFAA